MKGEILIKNLFNLFLMGVILEASVSALFSLSYMKSLSQSRPIDIIREVVIVGLAVYLSYKVKILRLFIGSGITFYYWIDIIISALLITRFASLTRNFFSKI